MRKILAAALLALAFSSPALAEKAMCATNRAGGQIILTTTAVKDQDATFIALTTTPGGETGFGQWTIIGERTVMVKWSWGQYLTLNVNTMTVCEL